MLLFDISTCENNLTFFGTAYICTRGVHDVFQCLEFHTLYECHINERKMMHVKLFLFSVVVHSVFRIVEKVVFS